MNPEMPSPKALIFFLTALFLGGLAAGYTIGERTTRSRDIENISIKDCQFEADRARYRDCLDKRREDWNRFLREMEK